MKKILLIILTILTVSQCVYAFSFFRNQQYDTIITAPLFNTKLTNENTLWVGTFQLLWNDLSDNVVNGPIIFSNGQTYFAEELNKQNFNKTMLSENSFYVTHGIMTKAFKKEIEKDLKLKFNDKSDILDNFNWNGKDFLAYAMLKKDFEFMDAFEELKKEKFGKSEELVKYFGFKTNTQNNLRNSIRVMFYNNNNDYAIKINTKTKDKVILYRTNTQTSFESIYNDFLNKSRVYKGTKEFRDKDNLKIPYIKLSTQHIYKELSGKHIKDTDLTIDKALQTVKFEMNNKGVKLKSEAAMINKMSLFIPENEPARNMFFDDTFVLFLIENDMPYFALRIIDVSDLNK